MDYERSNDRKTRKALNNWPPNLRGKTIGKHEFPLVHPETSLQRRLRSACDYGSKMTNGKFTQSVSQSRKWAELMHYSCLHGHSVVWAWLQEKLVFIAIITWGFPVIISNNQNETLKWFTRKRVYYESECSRGFIHVEIVILKARSHVDTFWMAMY